jgi:ribonucleotide reductase beta subunit family protein with ferritin-like domain
MYSEALAWYRLLKNKLDSSVVYDIICEAVDIEREFITESLPVNLIGMNSGFMADYIEFVADRLLVSLGQEKKYRTANPFPWMEQISLQCASLARGASDTGAPSAMR